MGIFVRPASPPANSQAYLDKKDIGMFTIHASNLSSCRFKSAVIPCECFMHISRNYSFEEDNIVKSIFEVGPPDVKISVPSHHDMLNELTVHIHPKLCRPDNSTINLDYRPFHVFPKDEESWTPVTTVEKTLKSGRAKVVFGCRWLQAEKWISVNGSSQNMLRLREGSIFPHCTSDYTIAWTTSQCRFDALHYRLRILAIPENAKNLEDEAVYIEEQHDLKLSCSQFDIIYEKYCFDLVSVNKNTSISHTWHSLCASTEPVERRKGGWSAWSEWSPCTETCGPGTQRRVRYCDEPVPKRAKYCDGPLIQSQECQLAKCPEAMRNIVLSSNCSCGCDLSTTANSFFASASYNGVCKGNQTWTLQPVSGTNIVDFEVSQPPGTHGRLFFFLRAPYEELVWASGSNQEMQFSLPTYTSIHIVLWSRKNESFSPENGFTISYSIRGMDNQPLVAYSKSCQPYCTETLALAFMSLLFIVIIFIPPIICASITASLRRNSTPDLPLMENKYDADMMRSANTEYTQVSSKNYVSKRSIGIQLSVQSTPRTARAHTSADSPLPPRLQSSLSECDELEYDYYDGTTIPGSMLAPVDRDVMFSQIDIDQIIGQSELFINNVEKQDVHTQI
ncbi:unnamed protein product [Caenorhabditis auriculariae]|uniref:Uncharacterized protein n=1 Tax=Caenorhabditis auriculariae TaxID=2777116 RepID=A0A8S1GW69_9PELO|nr:unnamed protein product [Caenorhabditis auriculariae]